ncbi:multicopper oxidase family protein [Nakamurella sp. GG22]
MTTQQLSALDLLLLVLATGLFVGAASLLLSLIGGTTRRRAIAAVAVAVVAVVAVVGRATVAVVLLSRGWWFTAEKVMLAVPLALAGAGLAIALAGPVLLREVGRRTARDGGRANRIRRGAAALFAAGFASAGGVITTFAVGYPLTLTAAVIVLTMLLGVTGLTWLKVTGRHRPRVAAALLVLCLLPVATGVAFGLYRDLQPVLIGATGHPHQGTGSPTSVAAAPGISVADLREAAPDDARIRTFTLTARQQPLTLPSGRTVEAWTFGSVPGPEIRVQRGDFVEVVLRNIDIADGVTVHWHGYPVPNGDDGVAGVTQDAVGPGKEFTYRFPATVSGTFWYHAHQVSSEAVGRGLYGALVVEPSGGAVDRTSSGIDLVVEAHTIEGIPLINGGDGVDRRTVTPHSAVRLRLINTDSVPHRFSLGGTAFTVAAVDGGDLVGPTQLQGTTLRIPAGGRYDATFEMPGNPVSLAMEGAAETGLELVPNADPPRDRLQFIDGSDLDLLSYGRRAAVPGFTDRPIDRDLTLVLDRQLRFLGGVPSFAQTVNGEVHPHVPAMVVRPGELVRLTVVNRGSETHPMHPHGHRVLVLSRDGVASSGSPLWLDTFDVRPGEVWQVLLLADNPGIWMAHCHNLEHATAGMVVHLVYEGVSSPFRLGGAAANRPE